MSFLDFHGARASNAGDDFHELWVLRQALSLLNQDSRLLKLTVEGLIPEDESGQPEDTWDGVDATFYYGDNFNDVIDRIVIAQFKYSSANPDQNWTVSRLIKTTNKDKDNSIIRKLAKAYIGVMKKYPELVDKNKVVIQFISNQSVDPSIVEITKNENKDQEYSLQNKEYLALSKASKLTESEYASFEKALDFSECGKESRFKLEEKIIATISRWTDDDSQALKDKLMRFVRSKMMPDSKNDVITPQTVLSWMGLSDRKALFPCPSEIKKTDHLIPRQTTKKILEKIENGQQHICLHGDGGCGKSTLLQEIELKLPIGSIMIIYDCYGGGRYLDSDAFRHRPQDAYLQLSNDLALKLKSPLLLARSTSVDYPRAFKNRLEKAAEIIASESESAKLIIVIDAADNSIVAAETQQPFDRSFIYSFISLGNLPENVCFLITTRTGRLLSLNLPPNYKKIELKDFSKPETIEYISTFWKNIPNAWIDDFHHLSGGNPRVQYYAIDSSGSDIQKALEILRPDGKSLSKVFSEILENAIRKVGPGKDLKTFCSGLVALPRPIPVIHLSKITGLNIDLIHDICVDLFPGIHIEKELISFSDEDFEYFLVTEVAGDIDSMKSAIADYFSINQTQDSYAAMHIASALYNAGRREEILELVQNNQEPKIIGDLILQREVQLQRLRIAMRVCKETNNNANTLLTLLYGAEAIKTDTVIRRTFVENPDLAIYFSRDTSSRLVLWDPKEIENHGRFLFYLMAFNSRNGDFISVRQDNRQLIAWLNLRTEYLEEQTKNQPRINPGGWTIEDEDIAAEIEAILRTRGPADAVNQLFKWKPKWIALSVALHLCSQFIISDESELIEKCINECDIKLPWILFLYVPLAISGKKVEIAKIITCLDILLKRGLIQPLKLKEVWRDDSQILKYYEMILTACEIVLLHGGNCESVIPILEKFADPKLRQYDQLFTSQTTIIDLSLRAHALLERVNGRKLTINSYLVEPQQISKELTQNEVDKENRSRIDRKSELLHFIEPIIDIYDARALTIIDSNQENFKTILTAINQFHQNEYRVSNNYDFISMRARITVSLSLLMASSRINSIDLFDYMISFLGSHIENINYKRTNFFEYLAYDQKVHPRILDLLVKQTENIKSQKKSAEEKIEGLINIARVLLPISFDDAKTIFEDAIQIADEVNEDVIHEISLFEPFVKNCIRTMSTNIRREVARKFAIIVSDAGIRISSNDHFPWEKASSTLTLLDVAIALSATARWEDEGIIRRDVLLPPLLFKALESNSISPIQAAAFSPFLNDYDEELIEIIVDEVKSTKNIQLLDAVSEHFAKEEALRFGKGHRDKINQLFRFFEKGKEKSFWKDQLSSIAEFHKSYEITKIAKKIDFEEKDDKFHIRKKGEELSEDVAWNSSWTLTSEKLKDYILKLQEFVRENGGYIDILEIFEQVTENIQLRDRVNYLKALCRIDNSIVPEYYLAQEIIKCINKWKNSPSVEVWAKTNLLQIIVDRLKAFSIGLPYEQSILQTLLERTGQSEATIFAELLNGIEKNVDNLSAPTVYALVGLLGQFCESIDAELVISQYADRLITRIPENDREIWNIDSIPEDSTNAIARFIYAYLGDIDLRIRWRAAHALRLLAKFGDKGVIYEIVRLYDLQTEKDFRDSKAPFYWMSARLWLLISLDRISTETPSIMSKLGLWLFTVATDNEFPHILIRHFAKTTINNLLSQKIISLDKKQQKLVDNVNNGELSRIIGRKSYEVGFERNFDNKKKERKFNFDYMDTLPYWYTSALRVFADVEGEEFLDVAETWIVDRWKIEDNPSRWEDSRKSRQKERDWELMYSGHGTKPIIESFHTYLELNAMWCTVGQLIQTRALSITDIDDFDSYEHLLANEALSLPGLWLSDIVNPKPRDLAIWYGPKANIDQWIDDVNLEDYLAELGCDNSLLVVDSYNESRSRQFRSVSRINTALVSPKTASSLVKALQTEKSSWDYGIPLADSEQEIKCPPYELLGWLSRRDLVMGIEERNPFRFEVRGIECEPSNFTSSVLNLMKTFSGRFEWINNSNSKLVFTYKTWGDDLSGEKDDRYKFDERIHSNGWRLLIDKLALEEFLIATGFDLIAEVEITRSNKGYDYSRYDEEKEKESTYDKILLFKRDGSIQDANGCLGTWKISSK